MVFVSLVIDREDSIFSNLYTDTRMSRSKLTSSTCSRLPIPSFPSENKPAPRARRTTFCRRCWTELIQCHENVLATRIFGIRWSRFWLLGIEALYFWTDFYSRHETTSGLLSFTFYYLWKNPLVLEKAREEVDRVLGYRYPTVQDIPKLVYIDQILKESLRLQLTAPVGLFLISRLW